MTFDFDTVPVRLSTDSQKWQKYAGRDILPLWVADMDFKSPPSIIEALHRRVEHGIFGYARPVKSTVDAVVTAMHSRYGWTIDPTWIVWHDSPAAARKSERWLELATRNWCWLCRRHGRGLGPVRAIALGAARAAMLAGLSPWRVWKVIRGLAQGLTKPVPAAPDAVRPDGSHLRRMLQIRGV